MLQLLSQNGFHDRLLLVTFFWRQTGMGKMKKKIGQQLKRSRMISKYKTILWNHLKPAVLQKIEWWGWETTITRKLEMVKAGSKPLDISAHQIQQQILITARNFWWSKKSTQQMPFSRTYLNSVFLSYYGWLSAFQSKILGHYPYCFNNVFRTRKGIQK